MAELVVSAPGGKGSEHPLEGEVTLGREGVDVILDDPGISRRHASVRSEGETVVVEDLGSSNGTFVNGDRIDRPVEVGEGDQIRLGATEIEVRGVPAATQMIGAGAPATEVHDRSAAAPPPARPAQRKPSDAAARVLKPSDDQNLPALAAIFLGPLSIFLLLFTSGGAFYISLPAAIGAIVFGSAGKRKVDRDESDRHRGLALAGQICGIIGAILSTLAIIAAIIVSVVLDAGADNLQGIIDQIEAELDGAEGGASDLIEQGSGADENVN